MQAHAAGYKHLQDVIIEQVQMKEECHIVICGDMCPTPDTETFFAAGDAKGLFDDLLNVFKQSDLVVGNLEFPLTDTGKGIMKCGPVLKGKKQYINLFKNAGFDVLGLANNHIRDCGDEGVLSTLECCRTAGILTVGAGSNAEEAAKPLVVEACGWKIGIMAFAEHEFNAASVDRAGANLFDIYESFESIKQLRAQCDYLVVLYHGGIEYYAYPSPILQKKCRKMVESGANLVLCQHSHCVGTVENYAGGTILYGQGNTVFGYRQKSREWNEGLIVRLRLSGEEGINSSVEYLPINAGRTHVDFMTDDQAALFLGEFFKRSYNVVDKNFIDYSWQTFCSSQQSHYFPLLLGLGRILTYLNKKMNNGIVKFLFSGHQMRVTMNLIRCEAHYEVVQTILNEYLNKDITDQKS